MKTSQFSAMAIAAACAASVAYAETKPQGDAQAGRALALQACTGCHAIAPDQPFKPIYRGPLRPPDFKEIADLPDITAAALHHHLATLPTIPQNSHMANPALTSEQISDVVAFIISLRNK